MNFGKFDATLLLVMSLAVISMSFVFPALGLTDDGSVSDSEIPEFDVQTDRFDIAGGFPNAPDTATTGTLEWNTSESTQLWDHRKLPADKYELFLTTNIPDNNAIGVRLNEYDTSSRSTLVDNSTIILGNGTTKTGLVVGEVGLRAELVEDNDPKYTIEYTITDRPDGSEGIIGSIFSSANATAQTLYWFGQIFFWFLLSIFDITLNVVNGLAAVTAYLFGLIGFLVTTYTGIVTAANNFASVFVAIPGLILSIILAKALIIGVKLLPTT